MYHVSSMIVFRRAQPLPVTLRHLALDSTYGAWASQRCGLGPIEGRSTALHYELAAAACCLGDAAPGERVASAPVRQAHHHQVATTIVVTIKAEKLNRAKPVGGFDANAVRNQASDEGSQTSLQTGHLTSFKA